MRGSEVKRERRLLVKVLRQQGEGGADASQNAAVEVIGLDAVYDRELAWSDSVRSEESALYTYEQVCGAV
mgnify:CR=1 FL=1